MAQDVHVRISLSGDLAEKFEWLKKFLGLKNNSEVVRRALVEAYNRAQIEAKGLIQLTGSNLTVKDNTFGEVS